MYFCNLSNLSGQLWHKMVFYSVELVLIGQSVLSSDLTIPNG